MDLMKHIAVVGTGYVGLVTGVCLAEIGHHVTCIDINEEKISESTNGISPIFEPGLEDLMNNKILVENRLHFTKELSNGLSNTKIIYIAVDTPQMADGSADFQYVEKAAKDIASNIRDHVLIIVVKSTVPLGINKRVKEIIEENTGDSNVCIDVIYNPEFMREGSAIEDTFYGDRIIIGYDNEEAAAVMRILMLLLGFQFLN